MHFSKNSRVSGEIGCSDFGGPCARVAIPTRRTESAPRRAYAGCKRISIGNEGASLLAPTRFQIGLRNVLTVSLYRRLYRQGLPASTANGNYGHEQIDTNTYALTCSQRGARGFPAQRRDRLCGRPGLRRLELLWQPQVPHAEPGQIGAR